MPSRRDQIRMTPAEIAAYLSAQRRVTLVTNGPDGLPHPVPMNYGIDAHGRFLITSFRKSQKVKNLLRDPRATLLVESGVAYSELKAVIAYCDCEIIEDAVSVMESMRQIRAAQTMTSSLTQEMSEQVHASIAKRVVLRFSPFRTVSWDHAKLGSHY